MAGRNGPVRHDARKAGIGFAHRRAASPGIRGVEVASLEGTRTSVIGWTVEWPVGIGPASRRSKARGSCSRIGGPLRLSSAAWKSCRSKERGPRSSGGRRNGRSEVGPESRRSKGRESRSRTRRAASPLMLPLKSCRSTERGPRHRVDAGMAGRPRATIHDACQENGPGLQRDGDTDAPKTRVGLGTSSTSARRERGRARHAWGNRLRVTGCPARSGGLFTLRSETARPAPSWSNDEWPHIPAGKRADARDDAPAHAWWPIVFQEGVCASGL